MKWLVLILGGYMAGFLLIDGWLNDRRLNRLRQRAREVDAHYEQLLGRLQNEVKGKRR